MKIHWIFSSFIYVFSFSSICGEAFIYEKEDGGVVKGYLSFPEKMSDKISLVLMIQGSENFGLAEKHEKIAESFCQEGFAVCSIEKQDPLYGTIETRFEDYKNFLQCVDRGDFQWWNKEIVLLGMSEGALVASLIAKEERGVKSLILEPV